jgi:hypothetical protein
MFQTMAIDVCLLFNVAVAFPLTHFRFLYVKPSLSAIGMKIGAAHRNVGLLLFVLPANR